MRARFAVLAAATAAVVLAGCSTSPSVPFREGVGGPPLDAPAVDPRCFDAYPELPATEPLLETELGLRPDGWPVVPDFAVLCWSVVDGGQETAYYATDDGITEDDVFTYYESVFDERSIHHRVEADTGLLLTGVHEPETSFYLEHHPERAYSTTWAFDGDYAE